MKQVVHQVFTQTATQVFDQVRSHVNGQVRSQVDIQVSCQRIRVQYYTQVNDQVHEDAIAKISY